MQSYDCSPPIVAKTLLARDDAGLRREDSSVSTPDGELFQLVWREDDTLTLVWPQGESQMRRSDLECISPDPLYESAYGICKHMEEDHADTFPRFLARVGYSWNGENPISMPWVEKDGFFLSVAHEHVFVPFPEPCQTSNDVRKTLIQMLREK